MHRALNVLILQRKYFQIRNCIELRQSMLSSSSAEKEEREKATGSLLVIHGSSFRLPSRGKHSWIFVDA